MLVRIEATTQQLRREMQAADQVVAKTNASIERSLADIDHSFDRSAQAAQRAGNLMRGAFAAIAGAGLVGGIIKQVDAVGQMEDRMRAATGSSFEYNKVQQALIATAKQTYRPLAEAQELYLLTADSIKSMGYNTQQTLDITDSFSYLLVTNAASADKGRAALDAYSKSLMTGRVGVDEWRSILSAMPTVVNALSDATGKSAEEIKRLGIEGKLSLDDLNKGFLLTVEQNQAAAARMRASVTDAMVNINTAIGVYLGQMENGAGAVGLLADALGVVADNIGVVAGVMAGAGAAALTLYVARTGLAIKAAYDDRAARIAQAKAVLEAAIADQRKAQTAVFLAQKEAAAAKGTAVQTQMSIQLAQARQREASATAALATAQAGLKQVSAGLLSVLGGPVGLALMAGTAAASFLMLRDNSAEARIGLEEIKRPVQELRTEFQGLARDQREAALLRWKDEQARAAEDVKAAYAEMGAALRAALVDQSDARSPGYVQQLQQYQELINRLNQARDAGEDLAPILRDIAASSGLPPETLESLIKQAGALSESDDKAARLAEILRVLTADLEVNTAAVSSNAAAHGQLSKSASDYIAAIEKRTAAIEDGNDPIKQATRHIEEHGKYTEDEAKAILKAAEAQKAAQDARAKATEGRKTSKKAIDEQIKAVDALIAKYDPATKAQDDYEKAVALADEALLKGKYTTEQYQKVIQGLYTDLNKPIWDEHNKQAKEAADAIKKIDDQLESVRDRMDPVRAATKRLTAEKKLLKEGLDAGRVSLEEYQLRLRQLDDEYARNQKSTSQWAQWTESALERVDSAFADAWRNIGDGFSSFRDSLTNAFKQMLAELAHMAITRPIVMQIGASMGIGGGTQGNNGVWGSLLGGSNGSGGGMGWGQILNYGQSAYSAITGVGPAALAGWQSGGLSGALSGVGGYYGNMLGGAASTVGGWFGYGGAAASAAAAQQAGFAAGNSLAVNAGMYASGGAATGAGAGAGGILSSMGGMLSNPVTWIVAGMLASNKLYGQGVRADGSKTAEYAKDSSAIGKAAWAPFTVGSYAVEKMDKIIGAVWGDRYAAVLTGSPVFQAITDFIGGGIFGGKWQTKDVGIGLGVEGGDFLAQQYEYQKKKGGWFKKNKKRTLWSDLDPETAAALQDTYDATEAGVAAIFEALSLSVEEGSLDGLQLAKTKISTKGKTEEQIQEAIAEWFGNAAEAMNTELNRVFGTGLDLDLEGMQAFVGNLQGVNEVLRYLDVGMYDASVSGGKLAEALSAAAGGLDALAANSATYYGAFFSEAEKIEDTIDSIKRAFESADVELAASREAYRAMVEDIDLTTEAGQKMFATLMALSGQAAQYFSIVEQQAAQKAAEAAALLMGTVNTAYAALQRSIAAQQREIQASVANTANNISALTGIGNSLDAALKKLRGTSDDTVRSLRAQAVMTLNSALVQARSGQSLAGVEGLQDALDTASQMDTALYGSLADFEREQGRTANLIAELEKVNGKQLSIEQRMLEKYEQQLSALDKQLAFAQSQLDALNGIDNSIMGVAAAIAAMNASVVAALQAMPKDAAKNNTPTNNRSIVDSIYQSVLGRGTQGDEAGASFWANALQSGTATYQDIATSIAKGALANAGESSAGKKSAEQYLKSLGIPGFASGGLFGGGLRIVGEKGPELEVTGPSRIYNASQTAAMLGGAGSTEELRALRGEVAGLRSALGAIAKYTESTAYGVRQMNEIGLPQGEAA